MIELARALLAPVIDGIAGAATVVEFGAILAIVVGLAIGLAVAATRYMNNR